MILFISATLNLYNLQVAGNGNIYYTAAVKSMLTSWHNFFFVSFDSAGFVTVDKPPLGLWIQALSAKVFGLSGFSVILPEAVAGVLSVALLFILVRRAYGPVAGLIAALILALTPVSIVVNRDNLMDSLLVFAVLLSVWAVSNAVAKGSLRWLLLSAVFLGLAFNIKTLEAYLALPAIGLVYLLAAPRRWRTRIWHLALALVVLLVVSFAWIEAVDLTPASQRPYVGSSQTNSELELTFGYNGIERVMGTIFGGGMGRMTETGTSGGSLPAPTDLPSSFKELFPGGALPGGGGFAGSGSSGTSGASLLRLYGQDLGGQISWLLPLAFFGILLAFWLVWRKTSRGTRMAESPQKQALILWGSWFLVTAAYFSIAGATHEYYLSMLAPCLAGAAAIGFVVLWEAYHRSGWAGWALPVVLVVTAGGQIAILAAYPEWSSWMTPLILVLSLLASLAMVIFRLLPRLNLQRQAQAIVVVGLLALLIAPATWSAVTTQQAGGLVPVAGPGGGGLGSMANTIAGRNSSNPVLEQYLLAHQGNATYLVATLNATTAAPIILDTGKAVMAMGGFIGSDPILTTTKLAKLVANGTARYFLLTENFGGGGNGFNLEELPAQLQQQLEEGGFSMPGGMGGFGASSELTQWVASHCTKVPPSATGGQQLYDCAAKG
jgi:4-amino-4-deoxy-L-arabinose transferase-like glycosyltransferase